MRKFWEKIKRGLSAFVVTAFLAQAILPATAQASGPVFNSMNGDKELLRGANVTNAEQTWNDPITGNAGDTFAGLVYYHNGTDNTVAQNTRVKVTIPAQTSGKTADLQAVIRADNASPVSDSLTVNLNSDAKIEFIPGSVVWYPDQNQQPGVSAPLPLGQSGDEIVSANGLNLGSINGCWEYAGFVVFKFKTIKSNPALIVTSKIAKNLTTGTEGTDIKASAGDQIRYTLTTSNTGGSATSVTVSDNVSDILDYADLVSSSENGVFNGSTITWPAVNIDAGATLTKTFTVKVKNPLPTTAQSGYRFDWIMYNVYGNAVYVRLTPPVTEDANLIVDKTVRNFTAGETIFVESNEAYAGDTLEYKIVFRNTGLGNADSVTISDVLPANVSYIVGTTVISQVDSAERSLADGITGNGVTVNVPAGSYGYIKFKVITSAGIAGGEILINTAHLKYASKDASDTASTKIKVKSATPIVKGTELPKTGAETLVIGAMLALAAGIYFIYRERKKRLAQLLAS